MSGLNDADLNPFADPNVVLAQQSSQPQPLIPVSSTPQAAPPPPPSMGQQTRKAEMMISSLITQVLKQGYVQVRYGQYPGRPHTFLPDKQGKQYRLGSFFTPNSNTMNRG